MHISEVIDAATVEQLNSSLDKAFGMQVVLLDTNGASIIDYPRNWHLDRENVPVAATVGRHRTADDPEVVKVACASARSAPSDCGIDCFSHSGVPIHVGEQQIGSWYLRRCSSDNGNGKGSGSKLYTQDTEIAEEESAAHDSAFAIVSATMRLVTDMASKNVRSEEQVREHAALALNAGRQHIALERIIDSAPVGLVEVDRKGHIIWSNQQAQRLMGFYLGEAFLSGTPAARYTIDGIYEDGSGGRYFSVARRLLKGEAVTDIRCVLRRSDGTSLGLRIEAAPSLSPKGRLERVTYSLHEDFPRRSEPGASEPSADERLSFPGDMADQSIAKRVEIAADFERSVMSPLQSAWIELDSLRWDESIAGEPMVAGRLNSVACLLHEAAGNAATVSSRCWPLLFDDLGIGSAIERRLRDLEQQTGLSWSFEERNQDAYVLERPRRAVLYQVAEELLTAVAADTCHVTVVLTANKYYWLLTISVHVHESAPSPFGGALTAFVREQLRPLGGSLETVRSDDGVIDQCVIVPSTRHDLSLLPVLEFCGGSDR